MCKIVAVVSPCTVSQLEKLQMLHNGKKNGRKQKMLIKTLYLLNL